MIHGSLADSRGEELDNGRPQQLARVPVGVLWLPSHLARDRRQETGGQLGEVRVHRLVRLQNLI